MQQLMWTAKSVHASFLHLRFKNMEAKEEFFALVYLFETKHYVSGLHKTPSCQGMWCRSELKFEGNLIDFRSLSCEIPLLLR